MLGEGKICLEEGSDGAYVFPVIIEQVSLLKIFMNKHEENSPIRSLFEEDNWFWIQLSLIEMRSNADLDKKFTG